MNKIQAIEHQQAHTAAELAEARRRVESLETHMRHLDEVKAYASSDAPVGNGVVTCSGCGADVSTERLFSEHYVIPDPRYYNLGNCPNRRGPE